MEKPEITGRFAWQQSDVTPSFIEGEDATIVFDALGNVPHNLQLDRKNQIVTGSSNIGAARIDTIVRPYGFRVATLYDLSRPEVMKMIEGKHYADTPALALISHEDSYKRNNSIIKQLVDLIEDKNGKVKFPLLVTGFDYQPDAENKDYGARIVARDDFRALHEDRLQGENNEKRFTGVDEIGMPIFDKNGTRIFYVKGNGVSRFVLDVGLGLYAYWGDLDISGAVGRVVLIRDAVATAQKNFGTEEINKQYEIQFRELNARKERALRVLQGKE